MLMEKRSHDSGCYTNTTKYGDAHESFAGNLVVDERAQVRGLKVGGLLVEQEVVVASSFAVVAELVVAEGEVVEAFSAALRGDAEDIREQADAELLVVSLVGLYETLLKKRKHVSLAGRETRVMGA
ncbi:hypothetical protein HG531_003295 [Fusarium graminearum]|nr:hypothetical protein HG531_003295 [Fusarium graminearum]